MADQAIGNEDEAYSLCRNYAHCNGFSVQKGRQSYFTGTKNIRMKDCYCAKEGFKIEESLIKTNYNKLETRTGFKAVICFQVNSNGQWKVIRFVNTHNHDFVKPEEIHLLRSTRSRPSAKVGVIDTMVNSGNNIIDAYRYIVCRSGCMAWTQLHGVTTLILRKTKKKN